jgi:hypothetical protein
MPCIGPASKTRGLREIGGIETKTLQDTAIARQRKKSGLKMIRQGMQRGRKMPNLQ